MKTLNTLFIAIVLLCAGLSLNAQDADYPVSVGLFAGPVDFFGDFDSHKVFDFGGDDSYFHFGAALDFYVNPAFDFSARLSTGDIGHSMEGKRVFEGNFTALDFMLEYKLNNGYLLKEDVKVAPYLMAGGGITDVNGDSAKIYNNLLSNFAWGLGLNIPLSERLSLDIRNTYKFTSTDNLDYELDNMNDLYMTLTAGLNLNLGNVKDSDGDGIADKDDACPDTPGLEALMGCPDSDGDGIADKDDSCPNAAGIATMMGCPDTDGDGIADADDECPSEAGVAALNGCPDSDGDGVADAKDLCPANAGPVEFDGCPDSDGDGLSDNKDSCPQVAGIVALMGCPDKDSDGVADGDDLCPEVAGIKANKGCPEVSEEVKEVFTQALKGIQFESGRDVIKTSSYGILNNVVDIMNNNPAYKLYIKGHTDSQGDDAMNLDLSERRAAAVQKYLTDRGVAGSRLRSKGFGEVEPVADNNTSSGRAKNRRVEFTVEF